MRGGMDSPKRLFQMHSSSPSHTSPPLLFYPPLFPSLPLGESKGRMCEEGDFPPCAFKGENQEGPTVAHAS